MSFCINGVKTYKLALYPADVAGHVEVAEGTGGLTKVVLTHSTGATAEVGAPQDVPDAPFIRLCISTCGIAMQ